MAPRLPRNDAEPQPESDRSGDLPHPRDQAELVGHRTAVDSLSRAARSGQLHHAWLISGPRGVGKATLGWRFARALLVHGTAACPEDLAVPAEHPASRLVSAMTHPDVALLRRPWDPDRKKFKTELPIDEVRRLRSFFSKHSSFGGLKIVIVDCVDDMNTASQNALLKVLEEPPKSSLLLLVSHTPGGLLPTIRSRCRSLQLRKLDPDDMATAMAQLCPGIPPTELELLSAMSEGAPGYAAFLHAANATPLYRDLLSLLAQLPSMNLAAQFSLAERIAKLPPESGIELFATLMMLVQQRMARAQAGSAISLAQEHQAFQAMSRTMAPGEWVDLWSLTRQQYLRADGLNLDKKQFVLNVFYSIESAASRSSGLRA